jgi:hypothetical protein
MALPTSRAALALADTARQRADRCRAGYELMRKVLEVLLLGIAPSVFMRRGQGGTGLGLNIAHSALDAAARWLKLAWRARKVPARHRRFSRVA